MAFLMVTKRATSSSTLLSRVLGGSLHSSVTSRGFSRGSVHYESDGGSGDETDQENCTVVAHGGRMIRSDKFPIERGFCDSYMNPFQSSGPKGIYEVKQVEEGVFVRMEMPGIDKEDVKVWFDNCDVLFVKGEAKIVSKYDESRRTYSASIQLPSDDLDIYGSKADIKNGVLRMLIPEYDDHKSDFNFEVRLK